MGDDIVASSADLDDFEHAARRALAAADPVPADMLTLGKLAFEFRDVTTVELSEPDLVGVRSATTEEHRVDRHGVSLVWSTDDGQVVGLVTGDPVDEVHIQRTDSTTHAVDLEPNTRSFAVDAGEGPFRLVVTTGDDRWATPWSS